MVVVVVSQHICVEGMLGICPDNVQLVVGYGKAPPEEGTFAQSLKMQRTHCHKEETHSFPIFGIIFDPVVNFTPRCELLIRFVSVSVIHFITPSSVYSPLTSMKTI